MTTIITSNPRIRILGCHSPFISRSLMIRIKRAVQTPYFREVLSRRRTSKKSLVSSTSQKIALKFKIRIIQSIRNCKACKPTRICRPFNRCRPSNISNSWLQPNNRLLTSNQSLAVGLMLSLRHKPITSLQWATISRTKTRPKDPQPLVKIHNKIMAIIKIQIMVVESLRKREVVAQTVRLTLLKCLKQAKNNLPLHHLLPNLQLATFWAFSHHQAYLQII